jgi:7-cyano-7-deazaguanine reductase
MIIDYSIYLNYDFSKKTVFMKAYSDKHAYSGINTPLPKIECFKNQFEDYEITISIPEYTSICPKSGLPDFGTITIRYIPDKRCVELKSLKMYILAYRNLGIFYENAVNRILRDFVSASRPIQAIVTGEFNIRGGMKSVIETSYPPKTRQKKR